MPQESGSDTREPPKNMSEGTPRPREVLNAILLEPVRSEERNERGWKWERQAKEAKLSLRVGWLVHPPPNLDLQVIFMLRVFLRPLSTSKGSFAPYLRRQQVWASLEEAVVCDLAKWWKPHTWWSRLFGILYFGNFWIIESWLVFWNLKFYTIEYFLTERLPKNM